jgi:alpha-tubulin suppressor-like RCC1 family protein
MRSLRVRTVLVAVAAAVLAGTVAPPAVASNPPPIWAWGNNSFGELGDGTFTQHSSPVHTADVFSGAEITQIVAGGGISAALLSNGTVWTWGDNFFGVLGNGSTGGSHPMPGQVPGLSGITQLAISYNGSDIFALGPGGVVWGWGLNGEGQLGNGTTSPSALPMQVAGLTAINQIAAGPTYTLALRSNGTVLAWGDNADGQLGDGTTTQHRTPVQVPGLNGIVQVSANDPSFAVRFTGTVFAWGRNGNNTGVLGLGAIADVATPTQIPGLAGITHLTATGDHVLALANSRTVYAWGANGAGELGDGTTTNRSAPEPLSLGGVTKIFAGLGSSAAIRSDGTLLTWGENSYGELGVVPAAPGAARCRPRSPASRRSARWPSATSGC